MVQVSVVSMPPSVMVGSSEVAGMCDWNSGFVQPPAYGMEDCLEIADALNALLSPGERDLCEELMSAEVTDFRCFHCPIRCNLETDIVRHCDSAHPYYEAKYHLPTRYLHDPAEELRWLCCACSQTARTRQELETHCVVYHRHTSRHFLLDKANLLKMSFTDRSYLQQPPSAPTPPQESTDILFNDFTTSETELEKLSSQATQVAVMALSSNKQEFNRLPPISSLLPNGPLEHGQDGYYAPYSHFTTNVEIDRGSSPYSSCSSVDFGLEHYQYQQLTTIPPKYAELECLLDVRYSSSKDVSPYYQQCSTTSPLPKSCDSLDASQNKTATGRKRQTRKNRTSQSKETKAAGCTKSSEISIKHNTVAGRLLKFAGPLSVKRKRFVESLPHVVGPKSVKDALQEVNIDLNLKCLPPTASHSPADLDVVLEENLKRNEKSFIHIAGCRLKVRDYASVVDIHPVVQLKDVLRSASK